MPFLRPMETLKQERCLGLVSLGAGGVAGAGGVLAVMPWKGRGEFRGVGLCMVAAFGGTVVAGGGLFSIIIVVFIGATL